MRCQDFSRFSTLFLLSRLKIGTWTVPEARKRTLMGESNWCSPPDSRWRCSVSGKLLQNMKMSLSSFKLHHSTLCLLRCLWLRWQSAMMVQYYCCGADIYQEAGAKWAVMCSFKRQLSSLMNVNIGSILSRLHCANRCRDLEAPKAFHNCLIN